jgi:hypothetical protein
VYESFEIRALRLREEQRVQDEALVCVAYVIYPPS